MVRRTKRSLIDKGSILCQFAGYRVYLGGLERFCQCKGRQDGGQTFCKHRFSRTGRTDKYHIVSACCGYLHGAFDIFLTFHIAEIKLGVKDIVHKLCACVDDGWLDLQIAVEEINDLCQCLDPYHIEVIDNSRFAGILFGQYDAFEFLFAGLHCYGQGTFDGLQAAVEREFAHDDVLAQCIDVSDLLGACQYTHCDGEVIGRTLLAQIRWREIDHDLSAGPVIVYVLDGGLYAKLAFFHSIVGQTDQKIVGSGFYTYLRCDGSCIDPVHCASECFD